jgi:hypothetical protein
MSARGFWIVGLAAALAVLIALNDFRSEDPGAAAVDSGGSPGDTTAAQRGVVALAGSPAVEQPTDAAAAPSRDAASPPARLPTPGPYASMSAALADHDAPPERRMPILPEVLDADRAFAAESVDPVWSTATEAGVLGRIAQIPGASYVSLNVECRTTLCLLQLIASSTPAPGSGIAEVAKLVESEGLKALFSFGIRVRGAPLGIAYLQRAATAETPAGAAERSAR